ncbi:MAG: GMC family oxidoreductase [Acidobacteria bacterium]|nr:GMC family oxidoreductase [Acidobacteriota bacterium]
MAAIQPRTEIHDVVVIGSGAGGATAAHVLTRAGIRVTLLEAGPMLDPQAEFKEHHWPYDYGHRGAEEGGAAYFGEGKSFGFFTTTSGGWELDGEPYTVANDTDDFWWFRSRIVGGRTNHYGRMSFRFSDYDFFPRDRDGLGWNWPIRYEDLAPYYDRAEAFIGVVGSHEGIRSAPDGVFHEPPPPKAHELLIQRASQRMRIPCIPNRRAVITRPINGRPACHYCGQCGRGCLSGSNYSASQTQIFPAMETGRLTVIDLAMARAVTTAPDGKVDGVLYIDKRTGEERRIRCRVLVVAASACESARLLLNSKTAEHRDGVANGSGVVGRYLMDTVGFDISGHVPALEGMPRYNSDGAGGAHLYMPWWGWETQEALGFPRGYHIEIGGGYQMPGVGAFGGAARRGGYGVAIKEEARRDYGTTLSFAGRGEMIPNERSWCEPDPDVVDRWGIPVLRFHFQWSDYERRQARHMRETFAELFHLMGGEPNPPGRRDAAGISIGGSIIHEVGTVRMGDNRQTSALNSFCQAHDVPNLFVCDAGSFVSNPDKNPTLTINALTWRASDYLADAMRSGEI